MLTTLLESRAHRTRTSHFMVASATVHTAIIFVAVYATAVGAAAEAKPDEPVVIHWVPMPKQAAPVFPRAPHNSPRAANVGLIRMSPAFSVDVPTSLPSIEVQIAPVTSELVPTATGNSASTSLSRSAASGGEGQRAYSITEVETAVSMIGETVPVYPSALRAAGIEGMVAAEFVVRESGRADVSSLRIITATNDAFVESIRRALPRMRFRPATIGGRAVAQLVQQQFVFRLDR
ncbi:MAG TPA: TonB family protein [Gemmatimonadaceae bacterium]|nr:TonB family protein [Gemmatimonadaceae bacterium]